MSAEDLEVVKGGLDALPIFPLPSAVLLPYELLPLHVFEPRYREMIADVLAGNRPLAIARLSSGWEGDYEGRPPVEPIIGVGLVARHEQLPDGRYNILLKGVARARIAAELPPDRSFREVRVRLLSDEAGDPALLEEQAESVRRMLFSLCAKRPGPASNALAQLAAHAPGAGQLADIIAAALLTDFDRRHRALVTLDPAARLELAQTAIAELLVGEAGTAPGMPN